MTILPGLTIPESRRMFAFPYNIQSFGAEKGKGDDAPATYLGSLPELRVSGLRLGASLHKDKTFLRIDLSCMTQQSQYGRAGHDVS